MAAITAAMVKELREMTGSGMMDCKKALTETDGNFDEAIEYLRKRGLAQAEKKASRIAAEGVCDIYISADNKTGAIVEVNSETDFVAKNEKFRAYVEQVAEAASETDAASIEDFLAKPWKFDTTKTVDEARAAQVAVIGENLKVRRFVKFNTNGFLVKYIHMNGKIGILLDVDAPMNDATVECAKNIAMQVAAMSPIALDEASVPQSVKDAELAADVEKAKQNQINKAVEVALKKAGINPAHVDSEDHIESNTTKGWITPEQAAQAREIKAKVAEEKAANLPEQMIQNIANGMLSKFFKESCLLDQAYIDDSKVSVAQYLQSVDKDLTVSDFKRFTLRAE